MQADGRRPRKRRLFEAREEVTDREKQKEQKEQKEQTEKMYEEEMFEGRKEIEGGRKTHNSN